MSANANASHLEADYSFNSQLSTSSGFLSEGENARSASSPFSDLFFYFLCWKILVMAEYFYILVNVSGGDL